VIDARQSPAEIRLNEPGELRSLKAVVVCSERGIEWPAAVARHDEHVWIRIDALRRLAAEAGVGPDWQSDFDAVLEFAGSRGWVDEEEQVVRAHVERRTDPPGAG
jgi:hypothetical protein